MNTKPWQLIYKSRQQMIEWYKRQQHALINKLHSSANWVALHKKNTVIFIYCIMLYSKSYNAISISYIGPTFPTFTDAYSQEIFHRKSSWTAYLPWDEMLLFTVYIQCDKMLHISAAIVCWPFLNYIQSWYMYQWRLYQSIYIKYKCFQPTHVLFAFVFYW